MCDIYVKHSKNFYLFLMLINSERYLQETNFNMI
jgi:hypothetical protein